MLVRPGSREDCRRDTRVPATDERGGLLSVFRMENGEITINS